MRWCVGVEVKLFGIDVWFSVSVLGMESSFVLQAAVFIDFGCFQFLLCTSAPSEVCMTAAMF